MCGLVAMASFNAAKVLAVATAGEDVAEVDDDPTLSIRDWSIRRMPWPSIAFGSAAGGLVAVSNLRRLVDIPER